MTSLVRPCLALALALMIALTSGAMATARGQARVAGEIVICTGQGAVSVAVDAQGQPTGAPHICPDCALGLFDLGLAAPTLARPVSRAVPCDMAPPPALVAVRLHQAYGARAPPLS